MLMDDVVKLIQFHEKPVCRPVHGSRTIVIIVHGDPCDHSAVRRLPIEADDRPVLVVGDVHEITAVAFDMIIHRFTRYYAATKGYGGELAYHIAFLSQIRRDVFSVFYNFVRLGNQFKFQIRGIQLKLVKDIIEDGALGTGTA